jgi:hypothetical protein
VSRPTRLLLAPPHPVRPGATAIRLGGWLLACVLVLWGWLLPLGTAHAQGVELPTFVVTRNDEGLGLSFHARFELPKGVEDALHKGVPLFFVAKADVFGNRWYWRDKRVASLQRTWRLAYQPLTRQYRVTFGGINQHHDNLSDAIASLSRVVNWKLAEPPQLDDGRYYVEFSYELDTTQMPRPLQIGIGGLSDWTLRAERVQKLP